MSTVVRRLRGLAPEHRVMLALLGATSFFEGYDRSVVALALPQIRNTFDLTQSAASFWLTALSFGALPALVLARRADRAGRRKLLLVCVVAYTLTTGLTAFAPDMPTFVALQLVSRSFMAAETALVWTIAAEELEAGDRGLGFGILGMSAALGVGAAAVVFGGILEPAGVSWRVMYLIAVPPLALVGVMRRRLPETKRFKAMSSVGVDAARWTDVFGPATRRRTILVLATAFLLQLTSQAEVFTIDFLQTDRGLSATASNLMLVGAGLPAIPLMVLAGSLSDRYGRRMVGCGAGAVSLIGALGLFWAPGGAAVLYVFMVLTLIGQLASWPVIAGYVTEMFPTKLRTQATAWSSAAKVGGVASSFALGGWLLTATGGLSMTVTMLAIGPVIGTLIVVLAFPDTHGRELEDTSALPVIVP